MNPRDRSNDDYTPITDMRGMGEALAVIKHDVKEMRPEVRAARDAVIELREWRKGSEEKFKKLESKVSQPPHGCVQTETITDLQHNSKSVLVDIASIKPVIAEVNHEIEEVKGSRKAISSALVCIILTILGSIGGWVWTLATLRAEVTNLQDRQGEVRSEIERVGTLTKAQTVEVRSAIKTVQASVNQGNASAAENVLPLEDQIKNLSREDRDKLQKALYKINR